MNKYVGVCISIPVYPYILIFSKIYILDSTFDTQIQPVSIKKLNK